MVTQLRQELGFDLQPCDFWPRILKQQCDTVEGPLGGHVRAVRRYCISGHSLLARRASHPLACQWPVKQTDMQKNELNSQIFSLSGNRPKKI